MQILSRFIILILISLALPLISTSSQNLLIIGEKKKVDINTAPLEDLVKIIHIEEKRGQELISLRPFYSLDELTKIKGIGKKKLADIKKQGLAWIDPKLKPRKIEKTKPKTEGVAIMSESFRQGHLVRKNLNPFSLFLIALDIGILSGIIILILKKKLKRNYNEII